MTAVVERFRAIPVSVAVAIAVVAAIAYGVGHDRGSTAGYAAGQLSWASDQGEFMAAREASATRIQCQFLSPPNQRSVCAAASSQRHATCLAHPQYPLCRFLVFMNRGDVERQRWAEAQRQVIAWRRVGIGR